MNVERGTTGGQKCTQKNRIELDLSDLDGVLGGRSIQRTIDSHYDLRDGPSVHRPPSGTKSRTLWNQLAACARSTLSRLVNTPGLDIWTRSLT